jgi:hypothetical protein
VYVYINSRSRDSPNLPPKTRTWKCLTHFIATTSCTVTEQYIYIYIYTYIHISCHIYMCIHIFMYVPESAWHILLLPHYAYIYAYICIHIHSYICMCIYICMYLKMLDTFVATTSCTAYIYIYIHIYIFIYIHSYFCMYIYIHTHVYTWKCLTHFVATTSCTATEQSNPPLAKHLDDDDVYLHKLQTRVLKNVFHIFPYRSARKA